MRKYICIAEQEKQKLQERLEYLRKYAKEHNLVVCMFCQIGAGTLRKYPHDSKLYCHDICLRRYMEISKSKEKEVIKNHG